MFSKPSALHLTAGSAVFLESCNLWLGLCWRLENCFPCQQCCLLSSLETGEPDRFSLMCQNVLTKVHKIKLKTRSCCCLRGLRLMHFSWSYESKTPLFQAAVCSLLGKFSAWGISNLQHTCIVLRKQAVQMHDLWSFFSNPYEMLC